MKKIGLILILLILCISTTFSLAENYLNRFEGYEKNYRIIAGDQTLSLKEKPIVIQNRIYLPLRSIAEALDYQVNWDQNTQTVTLLKSILEEVLIPCNPYNGEYFVYGEIRGVNPNNYSISIEQHIDDNSKEVFGDLQIHETAVFILQRNCHFMKVTFEDLKIGDVVGLILTKEDQIRGILIDG